MSVPHLAEGYVVGRGVNIPLRTHSALATGNTLHLDESWNIEALSVPLLETTPQSFLRQNRTFISDVSVPHPEPGVQSHLSVLSSSLVQSQ